MRRIEIAKFAFRRQRNLLPCDIANYFQVREPTRTLRNSQTQLSWRVITSTTHGAKSIFKKSLEIWEKVPNEIKQAPSLNSFKKMFKSHLILTNYPSWAQCVALPYQSLHCVCANLIYLIVVCHFADFFFMNKLAVLYIFFAPTVFITPIHFLLFSSYFVLFIGVPYKIYFVNLYTFYLLWGILFVFFLLLLLLK